MNDKPLRVTVFGKPGCDKCKVLNKRVDDLLAKPEYAAIEKAYCDLETEDGLVAFCRAECVNPNRVPALVASRWNPARSRFEYIPALQPGKPDPVVKKAKLFTYIGLQTDYSDAGQGLITPRMIASVLDEVREQAPP